MKINEGYVSKISIFKPAPEDIIMPRGLQNLWWNDDPSKAFKFVPAAVGPILTFIMVEDEGEGEFYLVFDNDVQKFTFEEWIAEGDGLASLSEKVSEKLQIDRELALDALKYVDAMLSDEAEDLDEGPFDYRWLDSVTGFNDFNSGLGHPENRLHIRVKSPQWSGGDAKEVEIAGSDVIFEFISGNQDGIRMGVAISHAQAT